MRIFFFFISMSKLDILEVLRLDTNNFSAGLPKVACQLKSLHTLGLGYCCLKSLPDGYVTNIFIPIKEEKFEIMKE